VTSVGQPTDAVFSPDGRWIAYQVGESNSAEGWTYVQPFPPTGTKHQIAHGGRPLWSRDGRDLALFFVPAPGQFMAVTVRTQPTFGFTNAVSVPRRFAVPGDPRPYDMLPDGRFVTVGDAREPSEQAPLQIQVVLNWLEELKQRVPTR
jgi:hypothetical protein